MNIPVLNRTCYNIEPPYKDIYDSIFLYISKRTGRRSVLLRKFAIPGIATWKNFTTSYSRYLFQIDHWKKHQQWIPEDMEVDHINNDKTDDRLENFQLLTKTQNANKANALYRPGRVATSVCITCGQLYRRAMHKTPAGGDPKCVDGCSHRCSQEIIFHTDVGNNVLRWFFHNNVIRITLEYSHIYEWYHGENYPRCEILLNRVGDSRHVLYGYSGIERLRNFLPENLQTHLVETPAERWQNIVGNIGDRLKLGESPNKIYHDAAFRGCNSVYDVVNTYFTEYKK